MYYDSKESCLHATVTFLSLWCANTHPCGVRAGGHASVSVSTRSTTSATSAKPFSSGAANDASRRARSEESPSQCRARKRASDETCTRPRGVEPHLRKAGAERRARQKRAASAHEA